LIEDSLNELKITIKKEELRLDLPTNECFGDLSTNIALKISKSLKKSPLEIAVPLVEIIKQKLSMSKLSGYIDEVKAEGAGFINFYFKNKYFYEQLQELLKKGKAYFRQDTGKGKPVLIEFVSANPTGPLSVAHARQAAVGDSLSNIMDFLGFKVKREYYLNDEGNQINILGKSVELRLKELRGEKIEFPQNYYQGDYIYDIAREIKNQKLKNKNLGEYASQYILNIIKKELDDFGVKFDYWRSQKELRKSTKIEKALAFLKKKGWLYERDGAVWFKSTKAGDDKDRVVVKSDSSYTYLAPDIAYHQEKFRRHFKWLINLWGPDHHGYINRLKAAVVALGYPANSLSVVIVQLASIYRGGKLLEMSTRKGQYITLREVLDEVGKDASRFFFLMRKTSSHLDFDLELAKKQTSENPVYYVQYAYARIRSILRQNKRTLNFNADLSVLKEKEEISLIKKLLQFNYVLNVCLFSLDPYMMTVYLQELAEQFHKFYDTHRVLSADEQLTQGRLCLIRCAQEIFALGLRLLGISRPEKM
ncbi:MAG: arginine--tRNA ligase, partial [Candidatus Omnitrophica bacterium]|nr:arginine--tRNA ligase [Candidatus Omnitrophota bacterium]